MFGVMATCVPDDAGVVLDAEIRSVSWEFIGRKIGEILLRLSIRSEKRNAPG